MSQENVEIVRDVYADSRGLTAGASGRVAPDAEFDFTAVYPDRPIMEHRVSLGDRGRVGCRDDVLLDPLRCAPGGLLCPGLSSPTVTVTPPSPLRTARGQLP